MQSKRQMGTILMFGEQWQNFHKLKKKFKIAGVPHYISTVPVNLTICKFYTQKTEQIFSVQPLIEFILNAISINSYATKRISSSRDTEKTPHCKYLNKRWSIRICD